MIRRKIWATATCCLALAGAARAESPTPKATIGTPSAPGPGYIARGVAPNPGYPRFVPRNYTAPAAPTYASPPANLGPATSGTISAPSEQFAIDAEGPATPVIPVQAGPAPASPMPGVPMGAPETIPAMPMPVPAAGPMPGTVQPFEQIGGPVPPGGVMVSPLPDGTIYNGPMLNGGPIVDAPYLSGVGMYGEGPMPTIWGTGEFLSWQFKGVDTPALITSAPAGSPGTINDAGTTVLFGGSNLLRDWNSGYRIRGGFWFPDGRAGLDIGFFNLTSVTTDNFFESGGSPGLFRPFLNTAIGAEDAQLVAFTDPIGGAILSGRIRALHEAKLWGAEANYRIGWGMGFGGRLDALVGYRYLRLRDRITIASESNTLVPLGAAPAGTIITTTDIFDAKNEFHGGQVGFVGEWQIGLMTFGMRGTIAVGATTQPVEISGQTIAGLPGGNLITNSGVYALEGTNVGNHSRQVLSVVPEIGITVGYQVNNNIRVFGGYNLLYWTNTVRAGEQINRSVNATFIPDPTTGIAAPAGDPAPPFHHRDANFYVHGYTAGIEFRW